MSTGLEKTLTFLQANWSNIIFCVAFLYLIINRLRAFFAMTKEEQVEAALKIVRKELLKFMSEAEIDWRNFKKSGQLKKSVVITQIYQQFPILAEYLNQDELIQRLSDMIDEGMEEMNSIINKIGTTKKTNKQPETETPVVETTK